MGKTAPAPARTASLLTLVIPTVGRQHPSTAVRRHNPSILGLDPFVRVSLPPVEAFLRGTRQAKPRPAERSAIQIDNPAPQPTFARQLGQRVQAFRDTAGLTQSQLEHVAEGGRHDAPPAGNRGARPQ